MSTFEAISIQGIRSFDPNKAQVLDFFKPVTIILGQNGTGKTTIIESLKYATTGDFPPGSKIGGSFVHDPKLANETEIKAKISLTVKDLKGNLLNVSRALKATQKDKNKQVTLQTLDSSIKRTLPSGQSVSISSKCSDINVEMTNSLGVSKAVLDSVIFCHQEESNWPLTEGKAVKERFDDLFASTKYVKALDSIRKTKMAKDGEIKVCKTELKYLKINRDEAEKKLSDKAVLESNLADINVKIDDIKGKLDPTESSIHIYQYQISQLNQIESDLNVKLNDKVSNEKRIKELSQNISEPLNYIASELETLINESGLELERLKNEIFDIESQISNLKTESDKGHSSNNSLLVEKGGLNTRIEAHQVRQSKLNKRLEEMSREFDREYTPSNAAHTIENLREYVTKEEEILIDKLSIEDIIIKDKQKSFDDKISDKTKLEHDIEMARTNLKKKQIELRNVVKRITDIGEDAEKLESIDKDFVDLKEELNVFKANVDVSKAKTDIQTNVALVTDLEESLHTTDNKLTSILPLEAKFSEINSLTQQITEKSNEAKRIRARHKESLMTVFDNDVPTSNVKKLLSDRLVGWRTKSQKCQNSLATLQSQLATLTVEERQIKSKIDEKKELVKKFEQNICALCGHDELDQTLKKLKKKKVDLEEEISTVQGNVSLYKKFQKMLTTDGSDCPLCHRGFCNDSDAQSLIEEINEKINFSPDLDKMAQELTAINTDFEELLKLEAQSKDIFALKGKVISDMEHTLQSKLSDIHNVKVSVDDVTKEYEAAKRLEGIGNIIQVDVALMEKHTDDVSDIEKRIAHLASQTKMSADDYMTTVSEVRTKKSTLQNELINQKRELEELRRSYERTVNKENELTSKMNNLERRKLEIQGGQHEWSSLCSKKSDLQSEVDINESSIKSSILSLEPIIEELSLIKEDLDNLQQKRKSLEIQSKEKINTLKLQIREVETTLSDMKRFEKVNVQEMLNDLEKNILNNNNKIKYNNECMMELQTTIEGHKTAIGNHNMKKREMVDTLGIRHCQSTIKELDTVINALRGKLGGSNLSKMQSELTGLENTRLALKKELDDCNFNKSKAANQINFIDEECRQRYFDAGPIYINMFAKIKVLEMVVSDLEKYYKATDQAIMNHHKTKMSEINKILKELWMNTYYGKDIDYIEICSDEETTSAGSKKRSYNYRVVMVKSGCRLDMRGRCSAGQKVLASLLIRLALAEVFCLHCGVMSLDEPTTNLDRENIENLSYALVKIIKNRSRQSNFQLILITHDEEFLELISKSDYVDDFYKISCNANGHSEIKKSRIEHR